jgi:hypothetical protein
MLCNLWLIVILILIVIILGLIIFSNSKNENFVINTLPSTTRSQFDQTYAANIITSNNNQINKLLNQLQNVNPDVYLINYDKNAVVLDMKNTITSNIDIVNNSLASLDGATINNNSKKIIQLENSVSDLENIVNNLGMNTLKNKTYNTIKSLNNGLEMKLINTPNTIFQDQKTGSNIAGYMVMANNGCLSVGATDYDIYKCDDKNPKQIFKMEHILNETAYQNNIDTSLPFDNIDKSSINYPFVMMKSINNENCLTNNHGNLTVQPCYSFVAQRWFPL